MLLVALFQMHIQTEGHKSHFLQIIIVTHLKSTFHPSPAALNPAQRLTNLFTIF